MILKERLLTLNLKPFKILGIEHVGMAVKKLDGLSDVFSDIFGLEFLGSEEVIDQQVMTDIYDTGAGKLEFLKATDSDSPVSRFIDKKGIGMHHIALKVDNLQTALDYLNKQGIKLINEKPQIGAEGFKIAFLDPKYTMGILVELCEQKESHK